jgi:hypothetical protein
VTLLHHPRFRLFAHFPICVCLRRLAAACDGTSFPTGREASNGPCFPPRELKIKHRQHTKQNISNFKTIYIYTGGNNSFSIAPCLIKKQSGARKLTATPRKFTCYYLLNC